MGSNIKQTLTSFVQSSAMVKEQPTNGPSFGVGWPISLVTSPCKYTKFRCRTKKFCTRLLLLGCITRINLSHPSSGADLHHFSQWCREVTPHYHKEGVKRLGHYQKEGVSLYPKKGQVTIIRTQKTGVDISYLGIRHYTKSACWAHKIRFWKSYQQFSSHKFSWKNTKEKILGPQKEDTVFI